MGKYKENISDDSLWITATPTPFAKTLPFCISEAGHFIAGNDYRVQRDMHDSFLLLYTVNGQGCVQTGTNEILLSNGCAVMINCRIPHEYHTASGQWEFLWIHLNGSGIAPLFDITYPNNSVRSILMKHPKDFEAGVSSLINRVSQNDIAAYLQLSSDIHLILNALYLAAHEKDKADRKQNGTDDVQAAIEYIENNYFQPITVEDMIRHLPVSKYHFIRRFSRAIGLAPYSYLTNYRINVSKTMLRSTDKTVSEIAESCGFPDTSNFITHFKKHTGQTPLQYRRDFS